MAFQPLNKAQLAAAYAGIPGNVTSVNASYTSNTAGTILDVTSTQRAKISYIKGKCFVAATLAGSEAAGDYVIAYDSVVTAPIAVLGIVPIAGLKVGSIFGTSAIGATTFTTAATVYSTGQPLDAEQVITFPGGYTVTAAGNDIKFGVVVGSTGALVSVSTGVVRFVGSIGYDFV